MSLLKSRLAFVGIASVVVTGALFASESSYAAKAKAPAKAPAVTLNNISSKDFNNTLSAMKVLKPLAAKGTGSVAVILPDTTSSERWTEFDAPILMKAFKAAGLTSSQIIIQNAQGSDATFITDAQADITAGAKVILTTPEDSATGDAVEKLDSAAGVKTIDYDRLTLGGATADKYYVSFNNVTVGKLIGGGMVSCVKAWKVKSPKVIVAHGATTDNNATLFATGYFDVLGPLFSSGKWTDLEGSNGTTAGTWDPPTAETEFQQAFTANPTANAALMPNDETAAPVITYLQQQGVKPYTFPVTGQDATLVGLQNIISGYQCGTVYKPIFLEAEGAAVLAMFLRADKTPPKSLINGTTQDTVANYAVPSVLEAPEWVTPQTIESTVVKDAFVPASQICSGAPPSGPSYAADCKKYKIK
jgi:D-xylose transport system substrate-binding protein